MHATTVPASLHRSLPVSALSYIQMGEGLFQCDWRAHSLPQCSPCPSIASALTAPTVQPTPIHCLSTHLAHSAAHAHPLPQHSPRRLPPTDPCTFYTFAPRAWRCTHTAHSTCTAHTQRTVRAQHMSCVRGSAQHMRSTCVPVLAHRRGGVPGGAVPQAAPAPPAPGRPESGRLRRSVSPLLGASGSGSGSGTGVLSPMQRRAQPPPPPRGASSLPPSRPASSAVGGGDQPYDPFAHAHDALDEFKRPRR